jgi:uncharacterized protein YecT (DUF1311 family)
VAHNKVDEDQVVWIIEIQNGCDVGYGGSLASTPTELAVCADSRLWAPDNELAKSVRRELTRQPDRRPSILRAEREWVAQRDRDCPVTSLSTEQFHLCEAYQKRVATFSPATPVEVKQERAREFEKNTRLCKLIADRYRPLASAHHGEAPIMVLAQSAGSPIKLAKPESDPLPVTELAGWAAAQKPPFSLSPDLVTALETYRQSSSGGSLIKALGVDFYTIASSQRSMNCAYDLSFTVRGCKPKPQKFRNSLTPRGSDAAM